MDPVRRLIAAVSHDPAALAQLRHDSESLASALDLPAAHSDALRSADRFFDTEKPILDQPVVRSAKALAPPVAQAFTEAAPSDLAITASADTGTLLPGPDTGTYTITSSATATSTASPVTPGSPGAPAPGGPAAPSGPGVTPLAPVQPATPAGPLAPFGPAMPATPSPGAFPAGLWTPSAPSVPCGTGGQPCTCGDAAAITAVVSAVATTANTALAAITAIVAQTQAAHCATEREPQT